MSNLLDKVNSPSDLKKLSILELEEYSDQVREFIVRAVSKNGGHLASNLGAVDFTVALHYVFDCPTDKIIFDVGHQSYAHKIITGRKEGFTSLRHDGGVSGFTNVNESEYDCCTMGHSSTSLSIGLGLARARDLKKENYNVVCVIGDGAFTGGVALEALNDIGASNTPMIIVLNDNKMSISKNVGGMSKNLTKLRMSKRYAKAKVSIRKGLKGIPFVGNFLYKFTGAVKDFVKSFVVKNQIFEDFGVRYYGPFDGHDVKSLVEAFKVAKGFNSPAVIHLVTEKGKGNKYAEEDPTKYHGVNVNKLPTKKFSAILSNKLIEYAKNGVNIVGVTAAMATGTGIDQFMQQFPQKAFDVGIAEQHAVSLCSGLARGGVIPVFAVYSTFLQRAYDEIVTDICIDNLPCIFAIDHAGYVDGDGVTHQGIYDVAFLSSIPNMTIVSPKDGVEFAMMLDWAIEQRKPIAIRYSKDYFSEYSDHTPINGKWEVIKESSSNLVILASGSRMVELALSIKDATIVNARFIKPLDTEFLDSIKDKNVITIEDSAVKGGFGESVLCYRNEHNVSAKTVILGYKDEFISCLDEANALVQNDLTIENLVKIAHTISLGE